MLEDSSIFHFPAHFRLHYLSLFKLSRRKLGGGGRGPGLARQSKTQKPMAKFEAKNEIKDGEIRAEKQEKLQSRKAIFP